MARSGAAILPVIWRDGVHIRGTSIWCDALRTRDVCFVSNAHAIGRARHGQLIGTSETLAFVGASEVGTRLAVPYGRPFTLGSVRLELVRSGHGLGGASLLVEIDGYRVLYSNAVCPGGGGLGGRAEVRACDALVVAARYGDDGVRFPVVSEVVEQLTTFVQQCIANGGAAVLLVSSASKALDVVTRLDDCLTTRGPDMAKPSYFAHRSLYEVSVRLPESHANIPRLRRHSGRIPSGHVLFWPIDKRDALVGDAVMRVALVSGRAAFAYEPTLADVGFAWSDQADVGQLLAYIDQCAPERVLLTERFAESMAARLHKSGRPVHALGPPRQIELF